jgi:hypothetical protein
MTRIGYHLGGALTRGKKKRRTHCEPAASLLLLS